MSIPQEAKEEIEACLKHEGQLVQAAHQLMSCLHNHQLCKVQRIPPEEIGVHPRNRDGFGVSPASCHQLLSNICQVGWSDSELGKAICCEIGQVGNVLDFNKQLSEKSNGLMPAPKVNLMRYASLSCSHTNGALRCALNEVKSEEELPSLDGHLSMPKIQSLDKHLYEAILKGLEWHVIHRDVLDQFPAVGDLLQSALNVSSHLSKGESEWRMMNMLQLKPTADWNICKKQILQTKPQCGDAAPYMFSFLKLYHDVAALEKIDSRIKSQSGSPRALKKEWWVSISSQSKDWQQQRRALRHAMISHGYCGEKPLSPVDVRKLLGKDYGPQSNEAEKLMLKFQKLIANLQQPIAPCVKPSVDVLVNEFHDSLLLKVLDRGDKDITMEGLALKLVNDLEGFLELRLTSDFDGANAPKAAALPAAVTSSSGSQVKLRFNFSHVLSFTRMLAITASVHKIPNTLKGAAVTSSSGSQP